MGSLPLYMELNIVLLYLLVKITKIMTLESYTSDVNNSKLKNVNTTYVKLRIM